MATEQDVFAELCRVARGELELGRDVTRADRFLEDLQLDSMSLTVLAVALEDRFQVNLYDEEALAARTVGELCTLIERRSQAGAGAGALS